MRAGAKISGSRVYHGPDCRCGCARLIGLTGTVIEVAAGWVVAEFFLPPLTGGSPRRQLGAYEQ